MVQAISLTEVFDDISSRFLINLPDEELQSFDRLFFQLQEAAWFYSDFYSDRNPHLPKLDLKNFCSRFFQHSPILAPHWPKFETHFSGFKDYLGQVPVCGAIMLTPDLTKCLMVKGWGKSTTWGFPKGKINKQEPDSKCAAREVFEEIGHDISDKIDSNQYIEVYMSGKRMRLFIVRGIPETTVFQPQTRKEISQIAWFPVSELTLPSSNTPTKHKMYAVAPFIGPLRRWIDKSKGKRSPRAANRSSKKQQNNNKHGNNQRTNQQHPQTDGFWGNQQNAAVGYSDHETFGQTTRGWDPEEMFATNQKLFNVKSTVPQENTVLTPAEQAKYQQHLARLGLSNQRSDKQSNHKSPQKQRNKNQRHNKPSPQQQQQVKILSRNNSSNFPQPNKPQPLKPNNHLPNKAPTTTANSFLNFKFDTSAIMGSFAMNPPITV
jgi:mRNA-decapping enzyme subunit 2